MSLEWLYCAIISEWNAVRLILYIKAMTKNPFQLCNMQYIYFWFIILLLFIISVENLWHEYLD